MRSATLCVPSIREMHFGVSTLNSDLSTLVTAVRKITIATRIGDMKRLLLLIVNAGMLLVSSQAQAQSSVTLYGLIDVGVDWESQAAKAPGQRTASGSAVRMASLAASLPSRWGLRGKEELGGGVNVIFDLESGFAPNSGALNNGNRLLWRAPWLGLESP